MTHHQKKRKRPTVKESDKATKKVDLDRFAGSSEDDDDGSDIDAPDMGKDGKADHVSSSEGSAEGDGLDLESPSRSKRDILTQQQQTKRDKKVDADAVDEADVEATSSSDEGSNDEGGDSDAVKDGQGGRKLGIFHVASGSSRTKRRTNDSDDDSDDIGDKDEDDIHSSDNDEDSLEDAASKMASSGMAGAMCRILGRSSHSSAVKAVDSKSPILSKTKTPLQRQAEKEKQEERELRERRRSNREKHLQALHIPLSVATTRNAAQSASPEVASGALLAKELEQERMLRRVATRGVVALFNAIAQHQKDGKAEEKQQQQSASSSKASKTSVTKMTKDGFLELIKRKAGQVQEKPKADNHTADPVPLKWNALRDDYMLDSKKNWDENDDSGKDEDEKWTDDEGDYTDGKIGKKHSNEKPPANEKGKKSKVGTRKS